MIIKKKKRKKKTLPRAAARGASIFTTRGAGELTAVFFFPSMCGKAPDILQMLTRLSVCNWLRFPNRQTRCKLKLCWYANPMSSLLCLSSDTYGSLAPVSSWPQGIVCSAQLSEPTSCCCRPWQESRALNFGGADSYLLLWLSTHRHRLSLCHVLWGKIIICSERCSHRFLFKSSGKTQQVGVAAPFNPQQMSYQLHKFIQPPLVTQTTDVTLQVCQENSTFCLGVVRLLSLEHWVNQG